MQQLSIPFEVPLGVSFTGKREKIISARLDEDTNRTLENIASAKGMRPAEYAALAILEIVYRDKMKIEFAKIMGNKPLKDFLR